MNTLVIGAAIVDVIMKIPALPARGEDILCSETLQTIGGCAYNVAGILRNFEVEHDLFVPVGKGMYADVIAAKLKECGYDFLIRDQDMDNGYCLCLVEEDGERTFITVKGLEGQFKESWFNGISAADYQNIYVAGYQVCGNSGIMIGDWLKSLKNKTVFFAPGPVICNIPGEVMERIFSVNPILHLNEKEAFNFAKMESLEECIQFLYELNHNFVFVTMGEKGTLYFDGSRFVTVEAVKAEVVDTIGAGDSHVAAIIAGFSKGMDVERSVQMANRVASKIVGIQGTAISKDMFRQIVFI